MRVFLLLLTIVTSSHGLSNESIVGAFSQVFSVKDTITSVSVPVVQRAWSEVQKMGVTDRIVCNVDDSVLATVLMKAALGNLKLGMNEESDWSIVIADVNTGQLIRTRSFSATRFAVIESLLLVAIVALGRAIWLK